MLLYADEASLPNTASVSYQWSPKGKQPLIQQIQQKKERLTLFGAVQPRPGKVITHIAALRETPKLSLPFCVNYARLFQSKKFIWYLIMSASISLSEKSKKKMLDF